MSTTALNSVMFHKHASYFVQVNDGPDINGLFVEKRSFSSDEKERSDFTNAFS